MPPQLLSPSFILSAIIATALALAYHLWRGGGFFRLIVSIAAAWGGFVIGHFIGSLLGWNLVMVGDLHVAEGIIGAMLAIVIFNRV